MMSAVASTKLTLKCSLRHNRTRHLQASFRDEMPKPKWLRRRAASRPVNKYLRDAHRLDATMLDLKPQIVRFHRHCLSTTKISQTAALHVRGAHAPLPSSAAACIFLGCTFLDERLPMNSRAQDANRQDA